LGTSVPTLPPLLVTKPLPQLRWFGLESMDVPQFMLDDMEERARWERIEGETQWACPQLKSMRETLSSELELAQGTLEVLGKVVLPLGRVSLLVVGSDIESP
jgi:hypothetical protein